jgi:hypothetical protein
MNMALYENLKYIIAGEWCLLLLAFGLLVFRRQAFEAADMGIHLAGHLLLSLSAIMIFICEALLMLAGNLGMQSSRYLLAFYAEHLQPWLLFLLICSIVYYIFERIFFIINCDHYLGRRFLSGARLAIFPHESKDLTAPMQRIILLQ